MSWLGDLAINLPLLGRVVRRARRSSPSRFDGSGQYWARRYASGGTSGAGSYGHLAEFKAEVLNAFVRENAVQTVIEHGCGDGNQLALAKYPHYLGLDITSEAVDICRTRFAGDAAKQFRVVSEYTGERADLALSLDVVFHLVEDEVFEQYMRRLFDSAKRYVIVYSSNHDAAPVASAPHVRHRCFTRWVETSAPTWRLRAHIPNKYPDRSAREGSFAEFFVYERAAT